MFFTSPYSARAWRIMMRTMKLQAIGTCVRRGVMGLSAACALAVWSQSAGAATLAHWSFDAVSGPEKNLYADATGNRPAKIADTGKVTVFEGTAPFGQAVDFNGETGAYLTSKAVPIHATPFTIAVWVRLSKVAPSFVLSDWDGPQKS